MTQAAPLPKAIMHGAALQSIPRPAKTCYPQIRMISGDFIPSEAYFIVNGVSRFTGGWTLRPTIVNQEVYR